jgi:3-hydroxyisobutyrate dehydrogenase-like beta-hydroxyacid dehydrogenase
MEVGFLGLGIMGKAMAANLLRHGFRVTVWNRTLSKVRAHAELDFDPSLARFADPSGRSKSLGC